jgi:transcription antitermination factor NusG
MRFENKTFEKKWYAIYTRSRAEKKVAERILNEGFESYVPIIQEMRMWSDRKKKVKTVLIKSYVFVHVEQNHLPQILKIEGTVRVLRHMNSPAVIRDYEIGNLKLLCNGEAKIDFVASSDRIEVGDKIEVGSGTLMGLQGKCVKINGKKRVLVEIESLGSKMLVDIPVHYIKVIK